MKTIPVLEKQLQATGKIHTPFSVQDGLGMCSTSQRHRGQRQSFDMRLENCWMPHQITWNKVKNSSCIHKNNSVLAMRTSSQRLAAVRKREAMLLESVYSRSFCRNLASYLRKGNKKKKEKKERKKAGKQEERRKKNESGLGVLKKYKVKFNF